MQAHEIGTTALEEWDWEQALDDILLSGYGSMVKVKVCYDDDDFLESLRQLEEAAVM